jgi:hypothetical protein
VTYPITAFWSDRLSRVILATLVSVSIERRASPANKKGPAEAEPSLQSCEMIKPSAAGPQSGGDGAASKRQ